MKALQPYATKFQIVDEPNHLQRYTGWGKEDADAENFNQWFLEVYALLKAEFPWAELGFPPLAEPDFGHRSHAWLKICRPAIERADWLGVHSWWQSPPGRQSVMFNEDFGLNFKFYHTQYPDKPLEITEFGNSNFQSGYPISEGEIANEYVLWLNEVFRYPYIRSANAYILSSPDKSWEFFAWRTEDKRIKPVVSLVGKMPRPQLGSADFLVSTVQATPIDEIQSTPTADSSTSFKLQWPVDSHKINQFFGENPESYKQFGFAGHEGLDLQASEGSNVYAAADGEVYSVNHPANHPYGLHIWIKHQFRGDTYYTLYGQLQETSVKVRQKIKTGELIALSGNTGQSFGPHLHFGLARDGTQTPGYPPGIIDPLPYLVLPTPTPTVDIKATQTAIAQATSEAQISANCPAGPNGEFNSLWAKYKTRLGCPTQLDPTIYGLFAEQTFENGFMFWAERYKDKSMIAINTSQSKWYPVTWTASKSCPEADTSKIPLKKAMLWGWCENPDIWASLGQPTAVERGLGGAIQEFASGIILRDDKQNFYVLFQDDGTYKQETK